MYKSAADVKSIIDKAENELRQCFQFLLEMKHPERHLSMSHILDFQPKLSECLYGLMEYYKELCQEGKKIISQKREYNSNDFKALMSNNRKYKNAIKLTIELGKSLGDAFAWFFYRNNFDEINRHFEHSDNGLFVSGTGGRGEIEFIGHNQNIGGLFTLYHSITSILRIGDFSLYDISGHIVGVGELKTEKIGDHLAVNAYITSQINLDSLNLQDSKLTPEVKPPEFCIDRFKNQMKNQDSFFTKDKPLDKSDIYSNYVYDMLNSFEGKDVNIKLNKESSMVVFVAKEFHENLSDILLIDDTAKMPDEFTNSVKQIIEDDSDYNRLLVTKLDNRTLRNRTPIFWWDLNDDIIEKIIFKQVQVITVFNPSKLLNHFKDMGYEIIEEKNQKGLFFLRKKLPKGIMEFHGFDMIYDMIAYSFVDINTVINFVENLFLKTESSNMINVKIGIDFRHHTFSEN